MLDAIVARLIPTDANGPGATEARAAHYIDRALGGALALVAPGVRVGTGGARSIRAIVARRGVHAAVGDRSGLRPDRRRNRRRAPASPAARRAFFALVLSHTHQGTFGDPYYGGNANFVGWDLHRLSRASGRW